MICSTWLEKPYLTVDVFNFAYRAFCQFMKLMSDKSNSTYEQIWKKIRKEM